MFPQKNLTPADSIIDIAKEAKLLGDPWIQTAITAYSISEDKTLGEHLKKCLAYRAVQEKLLQYPFVPPSQEILDVGNHAENKITMGIIQRIHILYFIFINLFIQHCLVLGASGTGKTNLLYGIIAQCLKLGVPVIIFDKDKQDYRHLKRIFPSLPVFEAGKNFIFNPLQVPSGVKPEHWYAIFVQIFCKAMGLLDGSESLLLKVMAWFYEKYSLGSGSKTYPTFLDLYDKIKSYNFKGNYRAAQFQDSLLNRLYAHIALQKDVCEYSSGYPIEWIANNSFVLEVKSLTDRIARFNVSILLYALFMHRIAINARGNTLRNLVVIDEAKWLAPPGKNENIGFSPLTYVMSQSREAGIGLIVGDQTAQLEDSVFVNSRIKCCFRLGDGQDIEKVAKTFALTKEQANYITKLDTGECIVRIPREEPFVINTLKVNLG